MGLSQPPVASDEGWCEPVLTVLTQPVAVICATRRWQAHSQVEATGAHDDGLLPSVRDGDGLVCAPGLDRGTALRTTHQRDE